MQNRPQLVFDIAGVLLSNISLRCWKEMIQESNLSAEQLKGHFGGVKRRLWTGAMKEEEFWDTLRESYPELPISRARDILFDSIVPLPVATISRAMERVCGYSSAEQSLSGMD